MNLKMNKRGQELGQIIASFWGIIPLFVILGIFVVVAYAMHFVSPVSPIITTPNQNYDFLFSKININGQSVFVADAMVKWQVATSYGFQEQLKAQLNALASAGNDCWYFKWANNAPALISDGKEYMTESEAPYGNTNLISTVSYSINEGDKSSFSYYFGKCLSADELKAAAVKS